MRHGVVALVVIALGLTTACEGRTRGRRRSRDLHAVKQAVVKATGHPAVKAKLTNGRFLGGLDDELAVRQLCPTTHVDAKAQDIARVAFDAYPPRASLAVGVGRRS